MKLIKKISGSVKSSARKLGLVAALASSSLVGNGCGSGSGHHSKLEVYLTQPEIELTNRLVETQLDNGSWSEQHVWSEPIDYLGAGSQRVTGTAALGLFDAYKIDLYDGDDSNTKLVPQKLEKTKDFLYKLMDNNNMNISPINFEFMRRYNEEFGLSPDEQIGVQDAWNLLIGATNMIDGTDPSVQVDGLWNRNKWNRELQGLDHLIGLDNSYLLRSAIAMNEPQTEIDWLKNKLKDLPIDTEPLGGLSSLAHVTYALNKAGDSSINVALLGALNSQRNLNGSYGSDPESFARPTAYALIALKEVGSSDTKDTTNWLESQIRSGGYIYDPATNLESFEKSGDILYSLLMNRKP